MISMQMMDLYAITSIYFIKGIMDAQSVCNPFLVNEITESDKLTMIIEDKAVEMSAHNYIKFVLSEMSRHNLLKLRGLIIYYNNKKFTRELCFLLDYVYKKGCGMSEKFEGKNMKRILDSISIESKTFFTPLGYVKTIIWHDMIRQYLAELKLVHKRITSEFLDSYIVNQTINERKIEEAEQINEERRKFILSGGDVPDKLIEDN